MTEMDPAAYLYFSLLIFLGGACVGSFLNVCIHRIPRSESVVSPRSRCPECRRPIRWYDNLPLISFFALRGRCRSCGARISFRYVAVEALTAILFTLVWLEYGWSTLTPIHWLVVSGLILATFVDLEHMIIPDRVSLGGMAAGLILSALVPALHQADFIMESLQSSFFGLLVGAGSLWLVGVIGKWMFRKDAMGLGDVKLLGAIGAFTGWQGVLFTVMISSLLGSVVGLSLIVFGRKEWQSRVPYGPYLALAAVLWILWGTTWWDAYVAWLAGGV